jgi:hypothetical protein
MKVGRGSYLGGSTLWGYGAVRTARGNSRPLQSRIDAYLWNTLSEKEKQKHRELPAYIKKAMRDGVSCKSVDNMILKFRSKKLPSKDPEV